MRPVQQRNPVLTPAVHVALATVALGAVLTLGAVAGPRQLAAGVLLLGLVVAWGWPGALGLPSRVGTSVVVALGAVLLVGSVVPGLVRLRGPEGGLGWLPAAVSLSFLLAFAHQLVRRDGRPRVVESVSSVVLALAVVAAGSLLVPLAGTQVGTDLVVSALAAAAASAVADITGRWMASRAWLTPLSMVAGGGAAVGAAVLVGADVAWTTCLLLGVAVGVTSQAARALLAVLPTMAGTRPRLVAAAVALLVAGPLVYTVARVLVPAALPA